jgi:hypothetical protein
MKQNVSSKSESHLVKQETSLSLQTRSFIIQLKEASVRLRDELDQSSPYHRVICIIDTL